MRKKWKKLAPLRVYSNTFSYFFYTYDNLTVINFISGRSRIPHRRGLQLSRRGRQPTILPKCSKKLHEIAKILGGGAPGAFPPLDPPLLIYEFRWHDVSPCLNILKENF